MSTLFWRISTSIALAAVSFVAGASLGYRYSEGRTAVAQVKEITKYVDRVVVQAVADNKLTEAQVDKRTKARVKTRELTKKGAADAVEKANPICDLDDGSFGLLNDAIDAANGTDAVDQPVVPEPVRANEQAAGQDGRLDAGVADRGDGDPRGVPPADG